jgi:hypothetical protein
MTEAADGYRAVPYVEFAAFGLTECLACGALVGDTRLHTAWHRAETNR